MTAWRATVHKHASAQTQAAPCGSLAPHILSLSCQAVLTGMTSFMVASEKMVLQLLARSLSSCRTTGTYTRPPGGYTLAWSLGAANGQQCDGARIQTCLHRLPEENVIHESARRLACHVLLLDPHPQHLAQKRHTRMPSAPQASCQAEGSPWPAYAGSWQSLRSSALS